jgi:hypothetical protein
MARYEERPELKQIVKIRRFGEQFNLALIWCFCSAIHQFIYIIISSIVASHLNIYLPPEYVETERTIRMIFVGVITPTLQVHLNFKEKAHQRWQDKYSNEFYQKQNLEVSFDQENKKDESNNFRNKQNPVLLQETKIDKSAIDSQNNLNFSNEINYEIPSSKGLSLERQFINNRTDELEKIVNSKWNNLEVLKTIHH